ncbi:MAG: NAD(+)/NADH kinase [Clostridiales Family XIII bacterium]|jgi:NAD+ kinase|nr:NAD(+)/NADH kinase [Clostridiales Family XIII bacterium]
MESKRIISIIENGLETSSLIAGELQAKLTDAGFEAITEITDDAELAICIGGDGSFLRTLAKYDFPKVPFVGVNTGHLGFFQELNEEDIDSFIEKYKKGDYVRQCYRTVTAEFTGKDGKHTTVRALNDIVIKGAKGRLSHLDLYIKDDFVEKFNGDGLVISTPAGSTAYNYSLGGSIVDPRINLLQLTPIAAVNTSAYRSFTSGILLPPGLSVSLFPEFKSGLPETVISIDGDEERVTSIEKVIICLSEDTVELLRFKDYNFWRTVKEKLL